MALLGFLKKDSKLTPFEPSLSAISFFMVTLSLILFLFLLDFGSVSKGFSSLAVLGNVSNLDDRSSLVVEIIDEDGTDGCDLFDGDWVWDESYPLYESKDCLFMDGGFRCSENSRPDNFYQKWRWQPKHCSLPRFNASEMLERFRNRRIVFVGDSIGRNQWESFMCMLSSAVQNKTSVYEVNGNPIDKHSGFLAFRFKDYNLTVEYYRSPFLVVQGHPPAGSLGEVKMTLQLDHIDWTSEKWRGADLLVFNTGHWWNYEKTIRGRCYFQIGNEVKYNMSVEDAYRRSMETLVNWIDTKVNANETQVYFRTYAPVHFRGGDWKSGGGCHLETQPDFNVSLNALQENHHFSIALDVFSNHANKWHGTEAMTYNLNLLNITYMSLMRKDAHLSLYYGGPGSKPAPLYKQDCSHWCLPGVPDMWNELLYVLFLRRD